MAISAGEELLPVIHHAEFGDWDETPRRGRGFSSSMPALSTRTANFLVSFGLACVAYLVLVCTGKWFSGGGFVPLPEKADFAAILEKMHIEGEVEPGPMLNKKRSSSESCKNDPAGLREYTNLFDGCESEDKGAVGTGNCSPSVCQSVREVLQLQDPHAVGPDAGLGGHHHLLCARGTPSWIFCPKTCGNFEKCSQFTATADATGTIAA